MNPELRAMRAEAHRRGVKIERPYLTQRLKGLFLGPDVVVLHSELRGAEAAEVLAHELGHHEAWERGVFHQQNFWDRESFADAYAERLLGRRLEYGIERLS